MRLSLRTKQVLGVTALVGAVVIGLSVHDLAEQARVRLEESDARGALLAQAIYQRAFAVMPDDHGRSGLRRCARTAACAPSSRRRSTPRASPTPPSSTASGVVVAHSIPSRLASRCRRRPCSTAFVKQGGLARAQGSVLRRRAQRTKCASPADRPTSPASRTSASRRCSCGASCRRRCEPVIITRALPAGRPPRFGALLLAQWLLRPIHVLRSGLQRLERGEPAATLDLPQDEFGELGREIRAVSDKLLAGREAAPGPEAGLDSIVEHLADAVGIFGPTGEVLFANPALRALLAACERDGVRPFRDSSIARTTRATSAEPVDDVAAVGRERRRDARLAGDRAPRRRSRRPAAGRDDRRARYRGTRRGRVDDPVFAQARGARTADGRRGARGEEPAQRDDDSPRAAEGEADGAGRTATKSPRQAARRRSTTSTSSAARFVGSIRSCRAF